MSPQKYEFQTVYQPADKTKEIHKNFTFGPAFAMLKSKKPNVISCLKTKN
jgi:hypothetical protein